MNSVVHFEVTADDPQRAKKFYGDVFDWKFVDSGSEYGGYIICHTAPTDKDGMIDRKGAINGGIMKKDPTAKQTILTIAVDNIKESLDKVKENGGKIVSEAVDIPGIGKYARVEDTEGNTVSLMEPTKEWQDKARKLT